MASSSEPIYTDSKAGILHDGGYQVDDTIASTEVDQTRTVNIEHPESNVPTIHSLAQQGDLERIKELLDNGSAKATDVDSEGITALHWAAMNSAVEVCRLLLERGAEVDAVGGELHATPLHWATRWVRLFAHLQQLVQ
jgi:ankyrin repeat protein